MARQWARLRAYVCIRCGTKMWDTRRPEFCAKCGRNLIRKTTEYRVACDNRACKHNLRGLYCNLKEPEIVGGECHSFEPRKKA